MEAAAAAAASTANKSYPIVISSDDEDDAILAATYGAAGGGALTEELQMQEAILLSLGGRGASSTTTSSRPWRGERITSSPDPKGKRKLASEAGCSSGSKRRRTPSRFRCGICMEMVSISEQFSIKLCAHAFCKGCVGKYVAAKIGENEVSIKCPDPGCKVGFLAMEVCRDIIPVELFDRWSIALFESALGAKRYYCPFKDCSALLIDDSGEKITNSECLHCHRMFCAQCRVPWHDGVSCEVFGKLAKDERGKDDLVFKKLADKCKWQRCPKCKMYVERTAGCLLMKCRCGYYFCYHCAAPMSMNLHYCVKCKH